MPKSQTDSQTLKQERERRRRLRACFAEWAQAALEPAGHAPAAHHRLLISELDAISAGRTDRLMVLMPPGSAKSTYASVLFPAWWFTQHPASSIIAASHTAELAEHFGRQVRNLITEHGPRLGYRLATDNRAAARWQTTRRGEYFATGVRGPITGRRADLAIIDDPVKSQAEADNRGLRDHVWNWYRSDLATRLKPGGRVVLIMTRWHQDDLGGRLLAQQPTAWRTIRLPALAEADDPLGRPLGAPLWPEWEDATALERKRSEVGERAWAALYQQDPRPPTGGLFDVAKITILDAAPDTHSGRCTRAWDLAATAATDGHDPDWTVGLKLLRDAQGRFVVLDIVRLRGGPHEVEETIAATAAADGRGLTIGLAQDPGQAGKMQALHYARRLAGHHVVITPESGSKTARALPAATQIDARNFAVVRAAWTAAFIEELRDFPHGRKDDQVDALARALALLTDNDRPARIMNVPLLGR